MQSICNAIFPSASLKNISGFQSLARAPALFRTPFAARQILKNVTNRY
jgi:hypothetical protein